MKNKFKVGDKVKYICTKNEVSGTLTVGKVYVVERISFDGFLIIKNDEGVVVSYMDFRFELVSLQDLIEKAKGFIGKTLRHNGTGVFFVPDAWGIANKYSDHNFTHDLKEGEVVVFVEDGDYIFAVDENLEIVNNTIKLTNDHDAEIKKDVINVGCQSIPIEKVREILELWENLHG